MKKLLAVLMLGLFFSASQVVLAQEDTTSVKHKTHSTWKKGEHKAKKAEHNAKKAEHKASKKMKHSAKKDSTMEYSK